MPLYRYYCDICDVTIETEYRLDLYRRSHKHRITRKHIENHPHFEYLHSVHLIDSRSQPSVVKQQKKIAREIRRLDMPYYCYFATHGTFSKGLSEDEIRLRRDDFAHKKHIGLIRRIMDAWQHPHLSDADIFHLLRSCESRQALSSSLSLLGF